MPVASHQAILMMGIFFTILGIVLLLWHRKEKKAYYNSMLSEKDVKEFITHEPERPWLNAWQVGGRISLIIGIMLMIAGGVLRLVLY